MTRLWVRAAVRFTFWTTVVTLFVAIMAFAGYVEGQP